MANALVKQPYLEDELDEEQSAEWMKCALDCEYFIRNYVRVQHPTRGSVFFDLYDYQKRLLDDILTDSNNIILQPRQSGKALSLDTRIPTPDGWTTMGDINVGDKILGNDGNPTEVSFKTDVMINHNCYEVSFDNGDVITADAEHLWEVYHSDWHLKKTLRPKVMTTEEILSKVKSYRPKTGRVFIPTPKSLKLPKQNLPIDPYTLGEWLGDGKSSSNCIYGTYDDLTEIGSFIENAGYVLLPMRNDKNNYVQTISGLSHQLRSENLYNNKHIPDVYLRSSKYQRIQLLRGLMDSDGSCDQTGSCEFYQKNESLLNQVRELLSSLGIKSTKRSKSVNDETYWTLSFSTKKFYVFNLKRKRERQKELKNHPKNERLYIKSIVKVDSVPVRCIQVDNHNHMFLCGNTMIPTHNTALITGYLLWKTTFFKDISVGVAAHKGSGAKEIIARFKYAYEFLPYWMKAGVKAYNVFDVEFDNGSAIISQTTTETTFRGLSMTIIYLDEFAFVPPRIADAFWTSLLPSTTAGSDGQLDADGNKVEPVKLIATSTPNGSEGLFARLWYKSQRDPDDSMFLGSEVKNHEVPNRDAAFKKKMLKSMSPLQYSQEFDCVSSNTEIAIDGIETTIGELYESL